jgi:hypothetical protein
MTVGRRRSMASGLVLLLLNETGRTAEDGLLLLLLLELGQLLATREQRAKTEDARRSGKGPDQSRSQQGDCTVHAHGLGNGWRVVLFEKEGRDPWAARGGRRDASAVCPGLQQLETRLGRRFQLRWGRSRTTWKLPGSAATAGSFGRVGPLGASRLILASARGFQGSPSRRVGAGPTHQPGSRSAARKDTSHGPSELPLQVGVVVNVGEVEMVARGWVCWCCVVLVFVFVFVFITYWYG